MRDPVRLQFEGWPAFVLAGVPGAQPGTFAGQIAAIDPQTRNNGKVRVLVTPQEAGTGRRPRGFARACASEGWAVVNQVSIGYELWRRVNGFPIIPEELATQKQSKLPVRPPSPGAEK